MPKSRLRKGHKAKVVAYKKTAEDKKKSFEKKMRALWEQQQQSDLDRQMAEGQVQHEEVEGLNVDDFKMDDDMTDLELVEISQDSNFGIVEGVTSPDQL